MFCAGAGLPLCCMKGLCHCLGPRFYIETASVQEGRAVGDTVTRSLRLAGGLPTGNTSGPTAPIILLLDNAEFPCQHVHAQPGVLAPVPGRPRCHLRVRLCRRRSNSPTTSARADDDPYQDNNGNNILDLKFRERQSCSLTLRKSDSPSGHQCVKSHLCGTEPQKYCGGNVSHVAGLLYGSLARPYKYTRLFSWLKRRCTPFLALM